VTAPVYAAGRLRRQHPGRRGAGGGCTTGAGAGQEWILHAVGIEDCDLGKIREALGEILGGMMALSTGPADGCE